jgi:hypothetical protein
MSAIKGYMAIKRKEMASQKDDRALQKHGGK